MSTALLRAVADTFDRAIVSEHGRVPDVARARRQHETYAAALRRAGYGIEMLPADDDHPDCVFIEDTAVVLGSVVIAARPGAEERRDEVTRVVEHLGGRFPITWIEPPGTLDGGDVMIMGDTVYVGRSKRTNDEGIAQLRVVAERQGSAVVAVPVAGVLHLKSGVLPVDDYTVVVTPGTVDESLLTGLRIVYEAPHERHAFSALPLRNGEVLVTAKAPDTAALVADLGLRVVPVDVSEIQAADGGLTCISILFEH
jgi:dimethylargininase